MGSSPTKQAQPQPHHDRARANGAVRSDGKHLALHSPDGGGGDDDEGPVVLHRVSGSREERLADGDGKALVGEGHEALLRTYAHLVQFGKKEVAEKAYARTLELIDEDGRHVLRGMSSKARECMFSTLISETMVLQHSARSVIEIQRIARAHVGKGLKVEHFDAVLNALLGTCAEVLGEERWVPEVAQAYRHEFESISNMMKTAMTDADPNEFQPAAGRKSKSPMREAEESPLPEHPKVTTPRRPLKKRQSRVSFCNESHPEVAPPQPSPAQLQLGCSS